MQFKSLKRTIIQLISNTHSYSIPLNILNSEYIYPIQSPDILENMEGEDSCCKVEDYFIENYPEIAEQLTEYKNILGNGNYNPNKEYKLSKYFVKSRSFDRLNNIINFKKHPLLNKCISYVGDKGSGKTATQNCWLKENNELLNNENIIWVRCDGYKLYKLWEDSIKLLEDAFNINKEDRRVTLSEYIDIQLCYVFCKYSIGMDNLYFERILKEIKDNNVKYGKPISKDYPDKRTTSLYDEVVEINKNINSNEDYYKTVIGYSYAINEVLAKSLKTAQFEKKRWIALSKALQKYFYENNYWLLKIVDGIDNVHINKDEAKKYYSCMLKEVREFIHMHTISSELRLVALREGSYNEIKKENIFIKDNTRHRDDFKITHVVSCFNEINIRRIDYAVNNIISNSLIKDTLQALFIKVASNTQKICHNNARVFLNNNLTLCIQVLYRMKQLDAIGLHMSKIRKQLELKNKFLNGRLYLFSKMQWQELNEEVGVNWFNPFYYDLERYPCNGYEHWKGLCVIRIIQFLMALGQSTRLQLTNVLMNLLDYPQDLINDKIDDLRAFGMLDTKLGYDGKIIYEVSKKGVHFLSESFSNVDPMYYFCLDAPMPSGFVKNKQVNGHNNKLQMKTHYPFAAVSTTITFAAFLFKVNAYENSKYISNMIKYKRKYKETALSDRLTLPLHDISTQNKLVKGILHQLHSADPETLKQINSYIDKLLHIH